MADLSTANSGGPMGSSVTPTGGVTSNSGSTLLQGIGTLARSAFSAFEDAKELEKEKRKKAEELAGAKVLSKFRSEQLALVDAYEQGMPQAQVRTRQRELLNRYQANNPLLGDELMKAHTTIMATAGLGKVVDEGTAADQEKARVRQAALDAGFLQDAPDEDVAIANYLRFKAAGEKLQREQAELSYENAKLERTGKITSNESAAIALTEKKIQLQQQASVAEMADAFAPSVRDKSQAILQRFENGEIDSKAATAEINALRQVINTTITGGGRKAGSEYLTTVVAPMLETLDIAKAAVSGETALKDAQNAFEMNILRQKILATSNPENARVVAISEMFRNIDTLRASAVDDTVTRMMSTVLNENADSLNVFSRDSRPVDTTLGIIKDSMSKSLAGRKNVALEGEIGRALVDVMSGVSAYGASVKSPEQLKAIQNFLADPKVGAYINKVGGVPKEVLEPAKEALQQIYEQGVLPAIEKQLKQANVASGFKSTGKGVLGGEVTTMPAEDSVELKFAGSDVYFEGKAGAGKVKAKELNAKLAPVMNKTIRIFAHLNGGNDYKGAYEQLFSNAVKEEQVNDKGNP